MWGGKTGEDGDPRGVELSPGLLPSFGGRGVPWAGGLGTVLMAGERICGGRAQLSKVP